MSNDARNAPPASLIRTLSLHIESQLDLDLGGLPIPSGPAWESLPETSRVEVVAALARLLAKAGAEEEESGV